MSDDIDALKRRVADLESLLRDVPLPIDVWEWVEENLPALKTIPGWECPFTERDSEGRPLKEVSNAHD
jgi:hypothetical protein